MYWDALTTAGMFVSVVMTIALVYLSKLDQG